MMTDAAIELLRGVIDLLKSQYEISEALAKGLKELSEKVTELERQRDVQSKLHPPN